MLKNKNPPSLRLRSNVIRHPVRTIPRGGERRHDLRIPRTFLPERQNRLRAAVSRARREWDERPHFIRCMRRLTGESRCTFGEVVHHRECPVFLEQAASLHTNSERGRERG